MLRYITLRAQTSPCQYMTGAWAECLHAQANSKKATNSAISCTALRGQHKPCIMLAVLIFVLQILVQHLSQILLAPSNGAPQICFEDKRHVFEVLGMLVCNDAISEAQQVEKLAAVISPMVHEIETLTKDPRLSEEYMLQQQLGCSIEAIGCCSKSCPRYTSHHVVALSFLGTLFRNSPACDRVFSTALNLVASSLKQWPMLPELTYKVDG